MLAVPDVLLRRTILLLGEGERRETEIGAVNKALHAGQSIAGGTISGPAMIGVPAEFYEPEKKATSFWRKLVG